MLCFLRLSSFISTQFFTLSLDGWLSLSSKGFIISWYSFPFTFTLILVYQEFAVFFLRIYIFISLAISIFSNSFIATSELFCGEFFETFVILSAVLLPIKSSVAYAIFWIAFLRAVLTNSLADCYQWFRSFWLNLVLTFLPIFLNISLAKNKNP